MNDILYIYQLSNTDKYYSIENCHKNEVRLDMVYQGEVRQPVSSFLSS